MNRCMLVILILALLATSGFAQDWRLDDDGSGDQYNCELVHAVVEEYGDENLLQTSRTTYATVASFFDTFFPACFDRDEVDDEVADATDVVESEVEEAEDAVADTEVDIIVLEGGEMIDVTDECTVMMAEDMGNDVSLSVAGNMQDLKCSVSAYLPGESEPAEIDDVFTDTIASMDVRIEHVAVSPAPEGRYTF